MMTPTEAVMVLHDGYGDDCPAGGDEYLEARLVLIDAGLMEPGMVSEWELSCRWPRPEPSKFEQFIRDTYAPAMRDSLNNHANLLGQLGARRG